MGCRRWGCCWLCLHRDDVSSTVMMMRMGSGIQLLTETEFMHIQLPQNHCACIFPLLHTPACAPVRPREIIRGPQGRFAAGEIDFVFHGHRDAIEQAKGGTILKALGRCCSGGQELRSSYIDENGGVFRCGVDEVEDRVGYGCWTYFARLVGGVVVRDAIVPMSYFLADRCCRVEEAL